MKIKEIEIPIYYGNLILVKTNNLKKLNRKFTIDGDITKLFGAVTFTQHDKDGFTKYIIAFNKEDITPSLIAHEAVHLVNYIFRDRLIYLDSLNDEPQAYLTGWIVDQCHKFFKI